ncbi:Crp/Fnr family transcriptional regulator [Romboutsia sp.]|uniref:Crp/Fnr family transcriptional regulator n=1 Tax=Romboutsia sp. TaxID=1965302 RepID=UPI003F40EA26
MKNNTLYNLIEIKEVQGFVNKIPDSIKNKCKLLKFEKSKIITLKGNTIKNIYISLQGKMQVKNEFENGFIYNFAEVESISYIGAMEIMANENKYSSTLQTTTECLMIEIKVNDFINWINNDQCLTLEVLKFVSMSMHKQSLNKGEVLAYPAIYSLITYLINVYKSEKSETIYLQKSREEIGSTLGFSVRTINRNLKLLKEEKLISVNRKVISISKEQFNKLSYKLNSIK